MEQLSLYISENIALAPYLIFFPLLLAGFNLPVSEDVMLFVAAVLARKHPDSLYVLFFAVYLGAYGSDLVAYWLGRTVGPRLLRFRAFAKALPPARLAKISGFYDRHGVLTLMVGRFIPFGVRNALFLSAGLGRMHPVRFALADLAACTVSSVVFFWVYHSFGEGVIDAIRQANIALFGVALAVVASWIIVARRDQRAQARRSTAPPPQPPPG